MLGKQNINDKLIQKHMCSLRELQFQLNRFETVATQQVCVIMMHVSLTAHNRGVRWQQREVFYRCT